MMSSLSRLALWPELELYLKIELYDRDGGHETPRRRIEFRKMPVGLTERAMRAEMPCVACGIIINPIRNRKKKGDDLRRHYREAARHLYYAPCCPLTIRIGCSRGDRARQEYEAVYREHLEREKGPKKPPPQGGLFQPGPPKVTPYD